jgi:hypothetical protein
MSFQADDPAAGHCRAILRTFFHADTVLYRSSSKFALRPLTTINIAFTRTNKAGSSLSSRSSLAFTRTDKFRSHRVRCLTLQLSRGHDSSQPY